MERRDEFAEDFLGDIMPYVESHYRVLADRAHRAMAGLSMGGGQTLAIAFSHLDQFGYIGVFSSGIFGNGTAAWEQQRQKMLDDASLKEGLKVLWFATGSDDFLLTTKSTIEASKSTVSSRCSSRLQVGIPGSTGVTTSRSLPQCSSSDGESLPAGENTKFLTLAGVRGRFKGVASDQTHRSFDSPRPCDSPKPFAQPAGIARVCPRRPFA